jgi:hypothetical protein
MIVSVWLVTQRWRTTGKDIVEIIGETHGGVAEYCAHLWRGCQTD